MFRKRGQAKARSLGPARLLPTRRNTPCEPGLRGSTLPAAVDAPQPGGRELTIELLEERLAPATTLGGGKKTAGWGC